MKTRRVIPFLMLHNELLYKSKQFKDYTYIGDPLIAVKIFNEKQAQEICIVDTDITIQNKGINFKLLSEIAGECFMPLCYGGGIKTLNDIKTLNRIGFEKVILNSVIHDNPDFVKEAVREFGTSTIIGCIDFKKINGEHLVYKNGGTINTQKKVLQTAIWLENIGIGELLLNNIDLDGKMNKLNSGLISRVAKSINVPIIAAGGVSDLSSIKEGFKSGINAVAAGSMFVYKGPLKAVLINYPDKKVLNQLYLQLDESM